jgi:hypothetical protein
MERAAPLPPTPAQRARHITVVFPGGATLPEDFVHHDWNAFPKRWNLPNCLFAHTSCEAILTDLDGDGQPEILLFNFMTGAAVFKKAGADRAWGYLGTLVNSNCLGVREALRAGKFEIMQPTLKEIAANGKRLFIGSDCSQELSK